MATITVHAEAQCVRDLVNESVLFGNRERLGLVWDMVCASMDMIEDAQLAIESFSSKPTNDGRRYLEVYGLFQAFFLQQDALMHLAAGLKLDKVEPFGEDFGHIRVVRNKYLGHPTKRDKPGPTTTYHGLSRITINSNEVTAWTYPNFSVETINIAASMKQQEEGVLKVLHALRQGLIGKRRKLVMSFDGQKLSTERRTYEFEKLGAWSVDPTSDRAALAQISLDMIQADLTKVEQGIVARYDARGEPGDVVRMIRKGSLLYRAAL